MDNFNNHHQCWDPGIPEHRRNAMGHNLFNPYSVRDVRDTSATLSEPSVRDTLFGTHVHTHLWQGSPELNDRFYSTCCQQTGVGMGLDTVHY
ncbi:hypothetical protein E2C01_047868 [Portunus trituberculatus]|uniref:Uncharacterized protein n=1 Tax=Portunus trituberculatus TaxID=210409 RepID=A0A5B7G9N3_PORTR|nr:hypothetical protein [Portunus trituberculatus]